MTHQPGLNLLCMTALCAPRVSVDTITLVVCSSPHCYFSHFEIKPLEVCGFLKARIPSVHMSLDMQPIPRSIRAKGYYHTYGDKAIKLFVGREESLCSSSE